MRFLSSLFLLACLSSLHAAAKPNFIVIFTDDLGYGDIGCFGSETIKTPNIDSMAAEGMRFTDFYAQTVCGPSRAALMTGCYPLRVAIRNNEVDIHPVLHSEEVTIAEVLKDVGYSSIAIGKWDLAGHTQQSSAKTKLWPDLFPLYQGFDEFFGTPTSNDSIVNLYRDNELIEPKADLSQLTRRYTDEAIRFIKEKKDQPFFVYLAHSMPHVQLAVSEEFKGKSKGGLYGDVVEEIDWNVGRILQTLKDEGLDENTYVIFTSDNGPWYFGNSKGHLKKFGDKWREHGGSAGDLRGAKTSTWEGGLRVPLVIRAPGKVPAGETSSELVTTMDVLPTFAHLAGAEVPQDRVIDGHDVSDLFLGKPDAKSPTEALYYYRQTRLEGVRSGKWKLMLPAPANRDWANYSKPEDHFEITQPMLFNLEDDVAETHDVAAANPEIVQSLLKLAEHARNDIGDYNRKGANARFFDPQPPRPDIKGKKSKSSESDQED